jgi:hypothetical protein
VASRIEYTLVGEDATRRREILKDFAFHGPARTG